MLDKLNLKILTRLAKDEEGAALVEYGMLVGLIAIACIIGVTALGAGINLGFTNLAAAVATWFSGV